MTIYLFGNCVLRCGRVVRRTAHQTTCGINVTFSVQEPEIMWSHVLGSPKRLLARVSNGR